MLTRARSRGRFTVTPHAYREYMRTAEQRERREQEVIGQYQRGDRFDDIVEALNVSSSQIYRILDRNGISRRKGRQDEIVGNATARAKRVCAAYEYGATVADIAADERISTKTVRGDLRSNGIMHRHFRISRLQHEAILRLHADGLWNGAIARAVDLSKSTITNVLRHHRLDRNKAPREAHPNWKGGRHVDANGYVLVLPDPKDTIAAAMVDHHGRVREHCLVVAHALGRPLTKGETVHHRNRVRDDNVLNNLQLWSHSHPAGGRVADVLLYYASELERYSDDAAILLSRTERFELLRRLSLVTNVLS